jgi:serine/threonine-protein kinase
MEGRLIGQYRVTGVLGEGGMGVVYAAQHMLLERPAAVKILLPRLSDDQEIVTRFFNEARAATAIRHPGIVEVYDFGWTAEGAAFIVMEHLQGETLRDRRRRAPMRWSTALATARQIAGALGAAHAKGIVHRDLKPANIFLVPDPEVPGGERIKLLDFGIAKLAGAVAGQHMTRTGSVIGTPTYMAPEQCRGVAVDARADLYALGCILFELISGVPPFDGEGEGDVLVAHIHTRPPALASLVSGVPQQIESLVQRMLAKAPADRVQTTDELIRLIDAARTAIRQTARSGSQSLLMPEASLSEAPASSDHPAIASPSRLDTTRSSAAGSRPQQLTTLVITRRSAVLGGAGGLAILGALALTVVLLRGGGGGGGGDTPIQRASSTAGAELATVTPPGPTVAPPAAAPPAPAEAAAPPAAQAPISPSIPQRSSSPDAASPTTPPRLERRGHTRSPGAPPQPPATVSIRIDSTPPGATVMIDDDVVGQTPWVGAIQRSESMVTLKLRRAGYRPQDLFITPTQAYAHKSILEALPSAPPSAPPSSELAAPPAAAPPAPSSPPPQPTPS